MSEDRIAALQYPRIPEIPFTSELWMKKVTEKEIPPGMTGIWALGQNGFLLKTEGNEIAVIDPYLSDYCASGRGEKKTEKTRFLPVFLNPEDLKADYVFITHSHCDHADPYTLERLTIKNTALFFCSWKAFDILKNAGIPEERITICHPQETVTAGGIKATGTFALPTDATDLNHLGFIFRFQNGKSYYNSGDTANSPLLKSITGEKISLMTVCINAGYNNLSFFEAAELAAALQPVYAAPAHYDTMPHNFQPPELFVSAIKRTAGNVTPVIIPYFEPFLF